VIPDALKVLRLQPGHKFCLLGRLSTEVGWHHYDTIKELEENRKAKSKVFYERKKQLIQLRLKAAKRVEEQISPLQETLIPITYKV
jgi:large subunit ribosomal protein L13Ae